MFRHLQILPYGSRIANNDFKQSVDQNRKIIYTCKNPPKSKKISEGGAEVLYHLMMPNKDRPYRLAEGVDQSSDDDDVLQRRRWHDFWKDLAPEMSEEELTHRVEIEMLARSVGPLETMKKYAAEMVRVAHPDWSEEKVQELVEEHAPRMVLSKLARTAASKDSLEHPDALGLRVANLREQYSGDKQALQIINSLERLWHTNRKGPGEGHGRS